MFQIPDYEQRTLYGALAMTLAMLMRLINCRFTILVLFITTKRDECAPV